VLAGCLLQETPYPWHSVEGQMRCLADLAFMLGQYEFAVAHYRLAAQDYLAAPNSKWYAGAEVRCALWQQQLTKAKSIGYAKPGASGSLPSWPAVLVGVGCRQAMKLPTRHKTVVRQAAQSHDAPLYAHTTHVSLCMPPAGDDWRVLHPDSRRIG
jgi:hypothetical protein